MRELAWMLLLSEDPEWFSNDGTVEAVSVVEPGQGAIEGTADARLDLA
jgi:hypothetical protein